MEIQVPKDGKSAFEPQVIKKRWKEISDIAQKTISMYAKGMTTRRFSETIEDIYGEIRQLPIPLSNSFLHVNGNAEPL